MSLGASFKDWYRHVDPSGNQARRAKLRSSVDEATKTLTIETGIEFIRLLAGLDHRKPDMGELSEAHYRFVAFCVIAEVLASKRRTLGRPFSMLICAFAGMHLDQLHPFTPVLQLALRRVEYDANRRRPAYKPELVKDIQNAVTNIAESSTKKERLELAQTLKRGQLAKIPELIEVNGESLLVERWLADMPPSPSPEERALKLGLEIPQKLHSVPPPPDALRRWLALGLRGYEAPIQLKTGYNKLNVPERLKELLPVVGNSKTNTMTLDAAEFVKQLVVEVSAVHAAKEHRYA